MPTHVRTCRYCRDDFATRYPTQAACPPCQVIRDAEWISSRATDDEIGRDCDICSTTFYPIRSTYTRCPKCAEPAPGFRDSSTVPCNACGSMHTIAPGTQRTCVKCVQSSRDWYDAYIEKLRNDQHERIRNLDEVSVSPDIPTIA